MTDETRDLLADILALSSLGDETTLRWVMSLDARAFMTRMGLPHDILTLGYPETWEKHAITYWMA